VTSPYANDICLAREFLSDVRIGPSGLLLPVLIDPGGQYIDACAHPSGSDASGVCSMRNSLLRTDCTDHSPTKVYRSSPSRTSAGPSPCISRCSAQRVDISGSNVRAAGLGTYLLLS
jgi:hypothetical protein